jgi:hypothetical protein
MAVPESITIPLRLPRGEAMALAWLRPGIHFETCDNFASAFVIYDRNAKCDIIWSGANFIVTTSAEAGLAAR